MWKCLWSISSLAILNYLSHSRLSNYNVIVVGIQHTLDLSTGQINQISKNNFNNKRNKFQKKWIWTWKTEYHKVALKHKKGPPFCSFTFRCISYIYFKYWVGIIIEVMYFLFTGTVIYPQNRRLHAQSINDFNEILVLSR